MTIGGDDDEHKIEPLSDEELEDVHGGAFRGKPTTITGKLVNNNTIVAVNNDTLFAGPGDDNFNIGMPPTFKKR